MANTKKLMATFQKATETSEAIDALYEFGIEDDQIIVMTGMPYPEGSLERTTEWLRLPYIVLGGALSGFLFGIFLSAITPHLYRLDVGGHPTVSFPPAAVITFVFTMMATIISTFLGVLWEMNFPEFGRKYYHIDVTAGYLAVLVEFTPELEEKVWDAFKKHNAHQIQKPELQAL